MSLPGRPKGETGRRMPEGSPMNVESDAAELAGTVLVRPGGALPTIRSTRRAWAGLISRGRPAAALPDLLSSIYSLCGGAHAVASRHAVAAARGKALEPSPADAVALQADTLREHLRRLWLDAPALLPRLAGPDAGELAGCTLMRSLHALDGNREWIEHHVLGMPALEWLAGWQAAPAGFALRWADGGATWPARWLVAVRPLLRGLEQRPLPLQAHASPLELQRLAEQLRRQAEFALWPAWRGHTVETGCWTRRHDPVALGSASPYAEPWMRMVARVADVAHLLAPGGERWLALGGQCLGPREGLGWCEMARGLLIHWVRLESDERVADCRVIAPTEWNFHPFGAVARTLAAMPATVSTQRVRLLAAAYDPCVMLEIERQGEVQDA